MKFVSTSENSTKVTFREAVFASLDRNRGLFVPEFIPQLPQQFFSDLPAKSIREIGFDVARLFVGNEIPDSDLRRIVDHALIMDAPLVRIAPSCSALELFHGPTLAFKDFGARFLAAVSSYFISESREHLLIVVATSGDTGGAVAHAFLDLPGVDVVILFPSGHVSEIQERQLTTLGKNVHALEINGTFDTCQALAKELLTDELLLREAKAKSCLLTSANSVNLARLLPQSFYFFRAWADLVKCGMPTNRRVIFSIPSGNFGNLTGGILAQRMGLPIFRLVAATNINRTVPDYLETGIFTPRPSVRTVSSAMDVGNPSNFSRMLTLFGGSHEEMLKLLIGCSFTSEETLAAVRSVFENAKYILDPHGAVGYLGLQQALTSYPDAEGVFLHTAHPAKFPEAIEPLVGSALTLPPALAEVLQREARSYKLEADYRPVKDFVRQLV